MKLADCGGGCRLTGQERKDKILSNLEPLKKWLCTGGKNERQVE